MFTRTWLTLRRQLPWSVMGFLADAHRRGVLRQAGPVYQFRHINLQHRLATREPEVARIGRYFNVREEYPPGYQVALVKVIDPAHGTDPYTTPDGGRRFVGAVFKIKLRRVDMQDGGAVLLGSDGQTYSADLADIAGYTNLGDGSIESAAATVTRSVTFQVPDGVKVIRIQWTSASISGATVQWTLGR
jgi:hypothetical protein